MKIAVVLDDASSRLGLALSRLIDSLADHYPESEVHILSPFLELPPPMGSNRIFSDLCRHEPHFDSDLRAFMRAARIEIKRLAPRITLLVGARSQALALFSELDATFLINIPVGMRPSPEMTPELHGQDAHVWRLAKLRSDLMLFWGRASARSFFETYDCSPHRSCVLYPAPPLRVVPDNSWRNDRVAVAASAADLAGYPGWYYWRAHVNSLPLDFFGGLHTEGLRRFLPLLLNMQTNARAVGELDETRTASFLRRSGFGLIPSPNPHHPKFFNPSMGDYFLMLANGAIPLVGRHPEIQAIQDRYGCSITVDDSSAESLAGRVRSLLRDFPEDRLRELRQAGRRAHEQEFNWENQFAKIRCSL